MTQGEVRSPKRSWHDVAEELSHERDSVKLHLLVKELNQLMLEDERRKVLQRLTNRHPDKPRG